MKADSLTIADVFKSGGDIQFVLPHFQREYSWEKEHWKALLDDACEIFEEGDGVTERLVKLEHFLGSLVVIPDGFAAGVVPIFKLVDGQQRLTSISILLKSLSLFLGGEDPFRRRIQRFLLNDEQGELAFKLLPTKKHGDRDAFTRIISDGEFVDANRSRICEAFAFFQDELQKRVQSGIRPEGLLTVLTTSFKVVFINLETSESPYRIFESLNAKGKPLTQADLIRNYVAMRLPAADQERLFDDYWSRTEELLQESRQVGRIGELTAFFRHYLSMVSGAVVNENHVYSRFRDRGEREFTDTPSFEAEIKRLWQFARYYEALLRPGQSGLSNGVQRLLDSLNTLEAQTAYPFLLRLLETFAENRITDDQLQSCLRAVENYLTRRFIVGDPTNYQLKMFPSLWKELDPTRITESLPKILATKNYPTNKRVIHSVAHRDIPQRNARNRRNMIQILEIINARMSAGTGGYTVLDAAPTVEHIMPQKLSPEWQNALGPLWQQVQAEFLNTFGNLTLVTGEWNSSLSNSPFPIKLDKFLRHALVLNSKYFVSGMEWGRDEILERAEFLTEQILVIWPPLDPEKETAEPASPPSVEFSWEAMDRVARRLGKQLLKVSQARFRTADGATRVVGLCSKTYQPEGSPGYWYGLKISQKAFLVEAGSDSWLALEGDEERKLLLVPFRVIEELLPRLDMTEGVHWHFRLRLGGDRVLLRLPGGDKVDLTEYVIPANERAESHQT
ncbi:MAG TPA: DUF262 domain-containing protein [Chthoniobacterales bacterium]|nr:DUF262 domain-containing protein [Chthoniobacterales bacterium]